MDKLIDLINQGGTGEYDARQPQERGEAVACKDPYEFALEWRSINPMTDKVCKRCCGAGIYVYGDSSTWRRGIAGQVMTADVCDQCWGSGLTDKPWPSRRAAHPPAADARVAELEAQLEEKVADNLARSCADRLLRHEMRNRIAALEAQLAASREQEGRMREAARKVCRRFDNFAADAVVVNEIHPSKILLAQEELIKALRELHALAAEKEQK